MTDRIPVKANFTGSDVTSLGEFASNDSIPIAHGGTGAVNAAAARSALGVEQSGTALLKAGGALTGAVTTNSTFDGRDVAADGVTADAALPRAGGTMSGGLAMGANTITSTGKILFSNMYAQTSDLPSASTYHGMFAHVHATGKAYYAHGGAWVELGNQTDVTAALAKSGGTLSGAVNFADQIAQRPVLKDYAETKVAMAAHAVDLTLGNVQTYTLSGGQTLTFTNPPASGTAGSFTLIVTNGGSATLTWPTSVDWPAATAPALTASGVDILFFTTCDGGTIWYGTAVLAMG